MHHAGSADAALGSAVQEEGLLDGVKLIGRAEAFDGADAGAVGLRDGDQAGVDEEAVEDDGAGSAFALRRSLPWCR